jgi:hypothetical protein
MPRSPKTSSATSPPSSPPLTADWLNRLVPKRWIPHRPWPKQIAFLLLPDEEALFGGAAGGGKSDALLMGGLQYVDVPGYAALLLRRSFADLRLPQALIPRSHEWLAGSAARWNEQAHEWRFPSGATLTFGYCDSENDVYRYQGAEFQYIGFDEATQFTERQYTYLQSRLRRRTGMTVPLRTRGATNPGGVGHQFFYNRFVDAAGERKGPFIPSKLRDNPALDAESYLKRLANLDPVTRAQLEHGIWTAKHAGRCSRGPGSGAGWMRGPMGCASCGTGTSRPRSHGKATGTPTGPPAHSSALGGSPWPMGLRSRVWCSATRAAVGANRRA